MADDQQQPPDQPRDAAGRRPRPGQPDETRRQPAVSADDDTTIPLPTFGQPRAGDTSVNPSGPNWAARAGVPPPAGTRDVATVEEWQPPAAGRRWWLPAVLALVALAVLALLALVLWLLLRGDGNNGNRNTDPGAPAVPAPAPTWSSLSPSSTPTEATSKPAHTGTGQVAVPPLVGIDGVTAQSILDDAGLRYRLVSRASSGTPPGTVLETDPGEGSLVRKGSQVTLVIAFAGSSSAPLPSPSALPSLPTPSR
jgi:hypothetical protein